MLNQLLQQPYRVLGPRGNSCTISNNNETTEATRTIANNIAEEAETMDRCCARLEKNDHCATKILQAMRSDRRKKQYPRAFEYSLP